MSGAGITTRIKKVKGNYTTADFDKIKSQVNGRAVLVILVTNIHCTECEKVKNFITQLTNGLIHKLPQLVLLHGESTHPMKSDAQREREREKGEPPPEPPPEQEEKSEGKKSKKEKGESASLGDSRYFDFPEIPSGHGYCIYLGEGEVLIYDDDFDHDIFKNNIVDNIRRFHSSIHTLQDMQAKKGFMDGKRTGIIIEAGSTTPQSSIIKIEDLVKEYKKRLKLPVYFLKGFSEQLFFISKGETKLTQKGLNFEKFIKQIQKIT